MTGQRSRAADRILALAARPDGYRPARHAPWWARLAPRLAQRIVDALVAEGALVAARDAQGVVLRGPGSAAPAPPRRPAPPSPDAAALRAALEPLALAALRHAPNPVRPDMYRTVRVRLDLLRQAQTTLFGEMSQREVWDALAQGEGEDGPSIAAPLPNRTDPGPPSPRSDGP